MHDAGDLQKCVGCKTELFVSTDADQTHACLEDPSLLEPSRSTPDFRDFTICIPHKCSGEKGTSVANLCSSETNYTCSVWKGTSVASLCSSKTNCMTEPKTFCM